MSAPAYFWLILTSRSDVFAAFHTSTRYTDIFPGPIETYVFTYHVSVRLACALIQTASGEPIQRGLPGEGNITKVGD